MIFKNTLELSRSSSRLQLNDLPNIQRASIVFHGHPSQKNTFCTSNYGTMTVLNRLQIKLGAETKNKKDKKLNSTYIHQNKTQPQ